jgi:uncharacterized protein YjiS (DUF1127 family)
MSAFEDTTSRRRGSAAASANCLVALLYMIIACSRSILRGVRSGHDSRVAVGQLQSLSDWQLKDIGMHRSQLWHLARGASAPSTWHTHVND